MINRDNYLDVKQFMNYQLTVKQSDPKTVATYWSRLKHLLEWADDKKLSAADNIKPTYPNYLDTLEIAKTGRISNTQFASLCKTARLFFTWSKMAHTGRYRGITELWIQTIRPPRARGEQTELKTRELYRVEDVITMVTAPVETLAMRRTQAAAAMLFLSGMRVGAFVTLPINCVVLPAMKIYQLPERGVATKNRKAAVTTLLNIPSLLRVVQLWDEMVREQLPPEYPWFARLGPFGELDKNKTDPTALLERRHDINDDLRQLCERVGINYYSAHKFRHGHAVYALKRATTMAQLKAISQNLMHSTIGITDGIYGRLVEDDVHDVIVNLGEASIGVDASVNVDLERIVELTMRRMMENRGSMYQHD